MKRLIVGMSAVFGVIVLAGAAPVRTPATFEIILERSGQGWNAHCASGCAWAELAVTCQNSCSVLIDANGVTLNPEQPNTSRNFGFVVSGSGRDWHAESVTGTKWIKLGWGCPPTSCRVRLDEAGVGNLPLSGF